ncbi:MAG: tetratricopeptide repeat protein, partial [Bacteroidetes bacterium]|nr:tetratricopeptide repeat protein [Bacteroidota bacterium]
MSHPEIDIQNSEAWKCRYSDTEKASSISPDALKRSVEENYAGGQAYAHLNLAFCHFLKSENEMAIELVEQALGYFEQYEPQWGYVAALYLKGNLYEGFGDYETAMNLTADALRMAEEIGYTEGIADAYSVLGIIYTRLEDFDNAKSVYEKTLVIREKSDDLQGAASVLNRLGMVASLMGQYEEAVSFYEKSIVIRKELGLSSALAWSYLGLAKLHEENKQLQSAETLYRDGLYLIGKDGDKRCKAQLITGLGRVLSMQQRFPEAYHLLEDAQHIAAEIKAAQPEYEVELALSLYYELQQDYKYAFNHFCRYHELKEKILSSDIRNKIQRQQIAYKSEKLRKEAEIFKLKTIDLQNANDKIRRQNKDLLDSIRYAHRIQTAISPPAYYVDKLIPQNFILYRPKDVVSGDFYFVHEFHDKVIFAAVDCTGHGVPGALMSVIGYNWLVLAVREPGITTPGEVLSFLDKWVNETLRQTADESGVKDSMDLAVCVLDFKTGILQYAGSYNPLYYIHSGELHEIKADKFPIGVNTDGVADVFTEHTVQLESGDAVYLFSDGYADQFGG